VSIPTSTGRKEAYSRIEPLEFPRGLRAWSSLATTIGARSDDVIGGITDGIVKNSLEELQEKR
jgi:hypothetical protein